MNLEQLGPIINGFAMDSIALFHPNPHFFFSPNKLVDEPKESSEHIFRLKSTVMVPYNILY